MTTLRRLLVIQVLLLWQGGFLFYTTFVVSTGTAVLGSAAAQGTITARVTDSLNILGSGWTRNPRNRTRPLLATHPPDEPRRDGRAGGSPSFARDCSSRSIACSMPSWTQTRTHVVIGPPFYPVHRMYLWASTIQWLACLVSVWLMIWAWRDEDRQHS